MINLVSVETSPRRLATTEVRSNHVEENRMVSLIASCAAGLLPFRYIDGTCLSSFKRDLVLGAWGRRIRPTGHELEVDERRQGDGARFP
jgi:hypothetical protein